MAAEPCYRMGATNQDQRVSFSSDGSLVFEIEVAHCEILEKLGQLTELWWPEAAKYGTLPVLKAPGTRIRTYDRYFPEGNAAPKKRED